MLIGCVRSFLNHPRKKAHSCTIAAWTYSLKVISLFQEVVSMLVLLQLMMGFLAS